MTFYRWTCIAVKALAMTANVLLISRIYDQGGMPLVWIMIGGEVCVLAWWIADSLHQIAVRDGR